jgi:glycosyltransferase involved in cell wall biosynthesis
VKTSILWIIDSLGQGGAEHLMPGILSHLDGGIFDLRVCALQEKFGNPIGREIKALGIPVDLVSIPNLRDPGNLPRLLQYLKTIQPDVVHTQLEFSDTLGSLAARWLGIPSVSTQHVMANPVTSSREFWRHRLMWLSLKYCSRIIFAVSEGARGHIIKTGNLSPEKVRILYNGIDLTGYAGNTALAAQARMELSIPVNAPVLISVAYLREPKGIQFMLQALPAILREFPECRYVIVGDGDYRSALENLTRELGMENNVVFTGRREDVPAILAMGDIFVHPTLADALPTVLAEAMAAGKPIIASRVGGVPEMVEHGSNGLLLPPGKPDALASACLTLLTDPKSISRMGESGMAVARNKFNIDEQCRKLEACYSELAARGSH